MATRSVQFNNPFFQVYDASGDPAENYTIGTFQVGTDTEKDTWSDATRSATTSNPVTLGATGMVEIYGKGRYKVVIKDTTGAVYKTYAECTFYEMSTFTELMNTLATAVSITTRLGVGTDGLIDSVSLSGSPGTVALSDETAHANEGVVMDANGILANYDGSRLRNLTLPEADLILPINYIGGLRISDAAAPSQTITISAGEARDSTDTDNLKLSSAFTKVINTSWVEGTGNGAYDDNVAFAINTWYHVFVIYDSTGATTDVLISASATAPTLTLPAAESAGYTTFRRIGSFKTNGSSQITEFQRVGDFHFWLSPVLEDPTTEFVATDNIDATATEFQLSTVPTGFSYMAHIRVGYFHNKSSPNASEKSACHVYPAGQTFVNTAQHSAGATAQMVSPGWSIRTHGDAVNDLDHFEDYSLMRIPIVTTAQASVFATINSFAVAGDNFIKFMGVGWEDTRGMFD